MIKRGTLVAFRRHALLFGFVVVMLAACQDSIRTPFPAGLEPFDDDAVPETLDDTPTEGLRTSSTKDSMLHGYGRGFVLAPPASVYAAAHDPNVMIAICATTSQDVEFGNEPEYELSFLVHYFVDDIFNVEWKDQWRAATVSGTLGKPELVMIKHQKIEGSDFIELSEGTVEVLSTDDPTTTELRFVEHLDALTASADQVLAGMQHNYDALVAVAHGGVVPPCP